MPNVKMVKVVILPPFYKTSSSCFSPSKCPSIHNLAKGNTISIENLMRRNRKIAGGVFFAARLKEYYGEKR